MNTTSTHVKGKARFTHGESLSVTSSEMERAMQLLREAVLYARDAGQDDWQFAVEIGQLRKIGLTESALRWLISKGRVLHADEVTRMDDARRTFRPLGMFCLTESACFVLNNEAEISGQTTSPVLLNVVNNMYHYDSTVRVAAFEREHLQETLPEWDGTRHELCFRGTLVKRFKHRSHNQEAILATFQEEGWPYKVDDPLSPAIDCDPKRRLNDTIKGLNHHQENSLLRFRGDGTGEAVVWEVVRGRRSNVSSSELD